MRAASALVDVAAVANPALPVPLLIADGDIATTHIIARVIREAFGGVDIVYPGTLQQAKLEGRRIIISRLCLPELSWLPAYLRGRGIGYSYFLDDNFYALDTDYDAHNGAFFGHPAVRRALDEFVRGARQVIVMSPTLADALRVRFPEQQFALIAAPIDLALIDRLSQQVVRDDNSTLRIGYPSTRRPNVAALVAEVVSLTLARHAGRVEFEFMGWMPDALRSVSGVTFLPEVKGYENYVKAVLQRGWHVALAPLMDSPFENCKTNLKYREYAAFGIPGVYSDVPLYASCIRSTGADQTGILAANKASAWVEALEALLADTAKRTSIAKAARRDVDLRHAQPIAAAELRAALAAAHRAESHV